MAPDPYPDIPANQPLERLRRLLIDLTKSILVGFSSVTILLLALFLGFIALVSVIFKVFLH